MELFWSPPNRASTRVILIPVLECSPPIDLRVLLSMLLLLSVNVSLMEGTLSGQSGGPAMLDAKERGLEHAITQLLVMEGLHVLVPLLRLNLVRVSTILLMIVLTVIGVHGTSGLLIFNNAAQTAARSRRPGPECVTLPLLLLVACHALGLLQSRILVIVKLEKDYVLLKMK